MCVHRIRLERRRHIDVLVIKGSEAKPGFQEDVKGLSPKVAVAGVGDKAYRVKGDYQIESIMGNEYCSVSVGSEDSVKGVDALVDEWNQRSAGEGQRHYRKRPGHHLQSTVRDGKHQAAMQGLSALTPADSGSYSAIRR